jgi:GTP 3',8-cyclase
MIEHIEDTTTKTFNRDSLYLRVSVTGGCNLRCSYCAPRGLKAETEGILSLEDLAGLIALINEVKPVRKVRFTGGEPLSRDGVPSLVCDVAAILPDAELTLTTNGTLLEEQAEALATAGLHRINISIDSPDPLLYARITGGGDLYSVLQGIEAAQRAGFRGIKLNMVLMRRQNGGHLPEMVRLARSFGAELRFIELMPMSANPLFYEREFLSRDEALERLADSFTIEGPLKRKGTATEYIVHDGAGTSSVGFIASVSAPFCGACNRLRLDSKGRLYTCLRQDTHADLSGLLTESRREAIAAVADLLSRKKLPLRWHHRSMMAIGG